MKAYLHLSSGLCFTLLAQWGLTDLKRLCLWQSEDSLSFFTKLLWKLPSLFQWSSFHLVWCPVYYGVTQRASYKETLLSTAKGFKYLWKMKDFIGISIYLFILTFKGIAICSVDFWLTEVPSGPLRKKMSRTQDSDSTQEV